MFLRKLAGMALMLACLAGYWVHFGNRFAELEANTTLRDAAGTLSHDERERVQTLRTMLREEFGISARLVVRTPDESSDIPQEMFNVSGNILYMAVTPVRGEAQVLLPALVQRVLEPAFGSDPERLLANQLSQCVAEADSFAGRCFEKALTDTLKALGSAISVTSHTSENSETAESSTFSAPAASVRRPLNTISPESEPSGSSTSRDVSSSSVGATL